MAIIRAWSAPAGTLPNHTTKITPSAKPFSPSKLKNPRVEQLAQEAAHARREGRLEDARFRAAEAVAICREAGTNQKLARALMLLGQIERDTAHRETALQLYEEAAVISREVDQPLRVAHTVRHLADLHCEMGTLDVAEGFYNESLEIYRGERDASPGDLANAVRGFAVMKESAGASEEARVLWEEARTLYSALGLEEGVEECNARLSDSPATPSRG
jgi:tetratricopeptide (TPR) repeat protein